MLNFTHEDVNYMSVSYAVDLSKLLYPGHLYGLWIKKKGIDWLSWQGIYSIAHTRSDLQIIFTRDCATHENHWRIATLVTT